jgi:hypothetical protein
MWHGLVCVEVAVEWAGQSTGCDCLVNVASIARLEGITLVHLNLLTS